MSAIFLSDALEDLPGVFGHLTDLSLLPIISVVFPLAEVDADSTMIRKSWKGMSSSVFESSRRSPKRRSL